METGNMPDRSNNISVSIGLQNVMDRYGTDQKAIRYNGNSINHDLLKAKLHAYRFSEESFKLTKNYLTISFSSWSEVLLGHCTKDEVFNQ